MSDRPKPQQDAIDTALQVVRTIDALSANDDFRLFMERFTRRADALALEILHDDRLSAEDREKLRNRRLGILEVLLAPKEDREAQVRVLAGYGVEP
jgi:hypothetical protein